MEEYDYRGYTISYNADGNYEIDFDDCVMEFDTYDEATEWVDAYLEEHPEPKLRTYHIFFVTSSYNRGYDTYLKAYSKSDALVKLERENPDLARVVDIYEIDA